MSEVWIVGYDTDDGPGGAAFSTKIKAEDFVAGLEIDWSSYTTIDRLTVDKECS